MNANAIVAHAYTSQFPSVATSIGSIDRAEVCRGENERGNVPPSRERAKAYIMAGHSAIAQFLPTDAARSRVAVPPNHATMRFVFGYKAKDGCD